jgi:hypothetical protein
MWTFTLSDLAGNDLGEMVNADSRTLSFGLSRPAVASFMVRWDFPWLSNLLTEDLLLRVYDDTTLRFHGILTTVEVGQDEQGITVACTATDPSWRLQKRLCGKSANGTAFTTATDRAMIIKSLIDTANSETNGNTMLATDTVAAASTAIYTAGPYKPIYTCLQELSQTYDGFDWQITPQERDASGRIGRFFAESLAGATRASAVFEYGGSKANMASFTYQRNWGDLANKVYHILDDGAAAAANAVISSTAALGIDSQVARFLYEDVAEASGLTDTTLRQSLVDAHVDTRKLPRRTFTFTPSPDVGDGRVPSLYTDYEPGDNVRVRVNSDDTNLIDGFVRVWQVQVSVDSLGMATITPTLVDEEAGI